MAQLPSGFVSHTRKVCSLYKRALRAIEDCYQARHDIRYHSVILRQRFEEHRNIKDVRVAKKLLLDGEEELFQNQHYQPKKFPESVGGVAYNRSPYIPDSVLDYWDGNEKARYPKYFALREELKKEYEKLYYKLYPKTPEEKKK
ncbi:NADH dehydrogenase (ubiquinone) B22 subunit [Megachile rotundata]|uniref:NADH dehydrogenase (ubiquinone) B22 subunit n=1 Tax=Megachile rotundata TaxID=143995 RepID=UPI000258EFF6|nr:PREDICTED: NADH dehydrogenase [ubiquinone] 1 beta subcomplex subunit 9 [Megachile rotundata]